MSAPIKNTCPDIDKIVRKLDSQLKTVKNIKKDEYEQSDLMEDVLDDCYEVMDDAVDSFEELRKDNDILRTWGREMEEEAEGLAIQLAEAEEEREIIRANYHAALNEIEEYKRL